MVEWQLLLKYLKGDNHYYRALAGTSPPPCQCEGDVTLLTEDITPFQYLFHIVRHSENRTNYSTVIISGSIRLVQSLRSGAQETPFYWFWSIFCIMHVKGSKKVDLIPNFSSSHLLRASRPFYKVPGHLTFNSSVDNQIPMYWWRL